MLPTPIRVPYGKLDRFVDLQRTRIALGLLRGADAPEGVIASPLPNIVFVDTDLGADGENWTNTAASWNEHPSVDWASPVGVDDFGGALVFPREVLVGFVSGEITESAELELLASVGLVPTGARGWNGLHGVYRCRSESSDGMITLAALELISRRDEVLFAEPDAWFTGRSDASAIREVDTTSSAFALDDPLLNEAWGLDNVGQVVGSSPAGTPGIDVGALVAWPIDTGGVNAPVAILDVGVDLGHPDLNVTLAGNDVTGDAASPGDGSAVNVFDNHGTAVAGCLIAQLCNGLGSAGLAPDAPASSIRTFITLNASGIWASQLSSTVSALTHAEGVNARVSVNSNAYGFQSTVIDLKYSQTRDDGMVHVSSAGNSLASSVTYPASLPTVLAVSGIDSSGNMALFGAAGTNTGPSVVLCAPARDVVTTDRSGLDGYTAGDYLLVDGTSFSAPYVAATAALAINIEPDLQAFEVEALMYEHALDLGAVGRDPVFGFGLVRAAEVVMDVRSPEFDGTGDPVVLEVANAPDVPVGGAGSWIHTATGGDTVLINIVDPLAQFTGDPFSIGFEFPTNDTFPMVLPGFWLGATAIIAPISAPLPSSGFTLPLPLPPTVPEIRILTQGFILTTSGGLRIVTTPGLDLRIR
ncbi:MAG: S8 family serine peptidase [Planctomycetota bacterium]